MPSAISRHPSQSDGTCQPLGQRPRASSTAYQLYKRPYSFSPKRVTRITVWRIDPMSPFSKTATAPSVDIIHWPVQIRNEAVAIRVLRAAEVLCEPALVANEHRGVLIALILMGAPQAKRGARLAKLRQQLQQITRPHHAIVVAIVHQTARRLLRATLREKRNCRRPSSPQDCSSGQTGTCTQTPRQDRTAHCR